MRKYYNEQGFTYDFSDVYHDVIAMIAGCLMDDMTEVHDIIAKFDLSTNISDDDLYEVLLQMEDILGLHRCIDCGQFIPSSDEHDARGGEFYCPDCHYDRVTPDHIKYDYPLHSE